MTRTQYARWLLFSTLLARKGYDNKTERRRTLLLAEVMDFIDEFRPACNRSIDFRHVHSWDHVEGDLCVADRLSEYTWGRYRRSANETKVSFYDQLSACICAGLDMAAERSAGVIGFDVGTLRRMFPLGIPEWITSGFNPPLSADAKDEEEVWL